MPTILKAEGSERTGCPRTQGTFGGNGCAVSYRGVDMGALIWPNASAFWFGLLYLRDTLIKLKRKYAKVFPFTPGIPCSLEHSMALPEAIRSTRPPL